MCPFHYRRHLHSLGIILVRSNQQSQHCILLQRLPQIHQSAPPTILGKSPQQSQQCVLLPCHQRYPRTTTTKQPSVYPTTKSTATPTSKPPPPKGNLLADGHEFLNQYNTFRFCLGSRRCLMIFCKRLSPISFG